MEPHTHIGKKSPEETNEFNFFMVTMASGIARGRVRTKAATATESCDMAAILQTIGRQRHATLVYRVLL